MVDDEGNVLVVDDEDVVRQILSRWLSALGYRCSQAPDGYTARAMLSEQEFDLVLLDIGLPDESGIKLLPRIRRNHPLCAVVIITGLDDTGTAVEAMRLGAFDYVVKPFDLVALGQRVARALDRRNSVASSESYKRILEETVAEQSVILRQRRRELRALNNLVQRHMGLITPMGDDESRPQG